MRLVNLCLSPKMSSSISDGFFFSEKNFIEFQSDVNSPMRTILIDWLIEVADEYKLHDETLFLAVQYIDRFLSTVNITRAKLQLLGKTLLNECY